MKKLFVLAILVTLLTLTNAAVANTPGTVTTTPHKLPASTIGDIEIPFEVLDYAQMKYQGHAVTQALRSQRNGQPVYQLRVDNDDSLYDDPCIFLFYDMSWELLDEEKATMTHQPAYHHYEYDDRDKEEQNERQDSPYRNFRQNERRDPKPAEPVEEIPEEPEEIEENPIEKDRPRGRRRN